MASDWAELASFAVDVHPQGESFCRRSFVNHPSPVADGRLGRDMPVCVVAAARPKGLQRYHVASLFLLVSHAHNNDNPVPSLVLCVPCNPSIVHVLVPVLVSDAQTGGRGGCSRGRERVAVAVDGGCSREEERIANCG